MRRKIPRTAIWTIGFILFLAFARDVVSNGRPLYCKIGGTSYFPGLRTIWKDPDALFNQPVLDSIRTYKLWKTFPYDAGAPLVFAPIAFSAGERDTTCARLPPGVMQRKVKYAYRHWFGTDDSGFDVAAGVVSGARVAALTGMMVMGIAMIIGLFLGAIAGYYGDNRLRLKRSTLVFSTLGVLIAFIYAFVVREYSLQNDNNGIEWMKSLGIFLFILLVFNLLGRLSNKIPYLNSPVLIPADMIVMRMAEVFSALPKLILLISIAAILQENRNIWIILAVIGMFSWVGVATYVRAELLRIRELDFISAARGMGYRELIVLWKHAFPNALRSTLIAGAFGVGSAILIEASLSYLGFGDPSLNGASWGNLLVQSSAANISWWVILPASLAIGSTIMALNAIGESLSQQTS
ncbi:MAG: ABC transporter permease [Bacteroidota bacterium]